MGTLTNAQRKAAGLVAGGLNNEVVAREAGVSLSTLARWRRSPAFRETVERLRGTLVQDEVRSVAELVTAAERRLRMIFKATRLSAQRAEAELKELLADLRARPEEEGNVLRTAEMIADLDDQAHEDMLHRGEGDPETWKDDFDCTDCGKDPCVCDEAEDE